MTDSFYSAILNIADTGNGRASDVNNLPLPRMRNTYLHNGHNNPNDIIGSVKTGLMPIDIQGGNVITETGNFVFNVGNALSVKNGSVIGITGPFLFSGNIITALDSIKMVGNDFQYCRATCGKCGQLLDVVYGAPTFLIAQR